MVRGRTMEQTVPQYHGYFKVKLSKICGLQNLHNLVYNSIALVSSVLNIVWLPSEDKISPRYFCLWLSFIFTLPTKYSDILYPLIVGNSQIRFSTNKSLHSVLEFSISIFVGYSLSRRHIFTQSLTDSHFCSLINTILSILSRISSISQVNLWYISDIS